MLQFSKEVDLFLHTLFRAMGITGSGPWQASRFTYWAKDLNAEVGFVWWHGDWNAPVIRNAFAVWRAGEEDPIPIMSVEEVMKRVQASKERGQLGEYFKEVGDRATCSPTLVHSG
jgi:hypothetical protein